MNIYIQDFRNKNLCTQKRFFFCHKKVKIFFCLFFFSNSFWILFGFMAQAAEAGHLEPVGDL